MPYTEEYSNKVHEAIQSLEAKGGMKNKNVKEAQKLLKYYPENMSLKEDGLYGKNTIKAIRSFYDEYYWTEARRMQALKDKFGEKYIMQSELEQVKEYKKTGKMDY